MIIKILGTGAETYKPARRPRLKPSCLISFSDQTLLIDVGSDILSKLSPEEIKSITHILVTHAHRDAIMGFAKLNREFEKYDKLVPVYANKTTIDIIHRRFKEISLSSYSFIAIRARKTYKIGHFRVRPLNVVHDLIGKFPTYAYNLDNILFYGTDMGPVWDEYELKYFKNNMLAIIDGAYWDRQVANNHIAVKVHFDEVVSLNNRYTYFSGMGNQWPSFNVANEILEKLLKDYNKNHPESKVKEVKALERDGLRFSVTMNRVTTREFILKPGFDDILKKPSVLHRLGKKELIALHWRCHQLWSIKKSEKVLRVHVLVVKEMFKRGYHHNVVNDLDRRTYRILGREVKIFQIYSELEDNIVIKSDVVKFVGSSLRESEPNDTDIILHPSLRRVLGKFFEKYNPHFLYKLGEHGDVVNMYDLVLQKKPLKLVNNRLPNYTKKYSLSKLVSTLRVNVGSYVVEPYIEGTPQIIADRDNRIVYECVESNNKTIITDLLAYKRDNFINDILVNRLYFLHKKWLDRLDVPVLLPIRWVVKKSHLISFLRHMSHRYPKLIIRPSSSKYYDGKFVVTLGTQSTSLKTNLKPLKIFTPLKATGTAYHKLEFFNIDEAWETFGKYYVESEGSVRVEVKWDGLRSILQFDGNKSLIYFEDAKKDRSKYLPSITKELVELGDIILDGELMEKDENTGKWVSRHNLLKWSASADPGDDKNVYIQVFDVLYYKGQDLHKLPFSKRHEILKTIPFKVHLRLGRGWNARNKEQFYKFVKKSQWTQGSDGAMLKSMSSDYPLTGTTGGWAKFKTAKEIDVIVLERIATKKPSVYNYRCGYSVESDKYIPLETINGKKYGVIGKTFNTTIKATRGDIITVGVLEIKKVEKDGKIQYTWFHPRVLYLKPGKKRPDGVVVVERIHRAGTLPIKSFYDFFISKAREVEGQWTINEGDKGKYVVQVHSRGLEKYQVDLLNLKKIGMDLSYFLPSDKEFQTLHTILDENWEGAVKYAQSKDGSKLSKLISKIDISKLSRSELKVLSKVGPISIHQDLRLVPKGESYFEGGHWTSPGNQFKENRVLLLNEGKYAHFMIKEPHVSERGSDKEPVIRGPASWLGVGVGKPFVVAPGSVGATKNKYASFWATDRGTWVAGRQVSPHGKHFKVFKFRGKILNGWIVFMYAPIKGKRIWLTVRPKNQEKYEQEYEKAIEEELRRSEYIYQLIFKHLYVR